MTDRWGVESADPLATMRQRVPALDVDLDEWTLRIVHWHFSESTGSPFWLKQRADLQFDPIADIDCYAGLERFGIFDKSVLREARTADLLPQGLRSKRYRIFETGGTTGEPCRVINVSKLYNEIAMFSAMLEMRGLRGGDIAAMTPYGPHQYGHLVARLADRWSVAASFIDFDPRWVKAELQRGNDASDYIDHLVAQTELLLRRQSVTLLFTTSRLLLTLVTRLDRPLADYGVRGVSTGGTSCTPEEIHILEHEYLDGVTWVDTYGNTLVGHALMADPTEPGQDRRYYLPGPIGVMEVVDPAAIDDVVDYGERGRVRTTTLLEDMFIPNLLERDSAIRVGHHPWFPWDGVARVEPYMSVDGESAVEGVY